MVPKQAWSIIYWISMLVLIFNPCISAVDLASTAYLEGNAAHRNGNITLAKEKYRLAVSLDPQNYFAWTNLGHVLLNTDAYSEAIQVFEVSYRLQPYNPKANYNLAVSLHRYNEIDKAIKFYREALRLDSNYINCYYNLGLIYQDKGDLEAASKQYATVMALDPSHVESRLNQCNILFASDDLIAAEECYIETIRIQPTYVRALVNLASLYVSSGLDEVHLQRAADLYSAALDMDPANRMARHGLRSLLSTTTSASTTTTEEYGPGMDAEYVRELFDSYSFHFEASLRSLNYTSHLLVASLMADYLAEQLLTLPSLISVMDLGAGTGLVCGAVRNITADPRFLNSETRFSITGVDLSMKMLLKAKESNCYDSIEQGDITAFLAAARTASDASSERVQVIVLADVLVYFGELQTVLRACFDLLADGGVVVFTVEDLQANIIEQQQQQQQQQLQQQLVAGDLTEGNSLLFALQRSGRFGHSRSYIEGLAEELGFEVWRIQTCVPRTDSGLAVRGLAVALAKKKTAPAAS